MSYIEFDKSQLVNLEYSLSRELLRASRSGSYASTTIVQCNTRKSHGLLVAPQPKIDNQLHVLLSSFDETIIQHNTPFNLGIHKYPGGVFKPGGHKYIRDFQSDPIPTLIYRVGGVVLKKETLFTSNTERYLIRYTLLEAHSDTLIQFRPFLAFRGVHSLSKANTYVNRKYEACDNGIAMKLYDSYTPLYMQFSKKPEYVHVPDWYYNIEYHRDQEKGLDYQEDLFVPGYFELPIKKGESIVFSASLNGVKPDSLKNMFYRERNKRTPRNSFKNCLENAADQFIIKRGKYHEIVNGYPWTDNGGRDTFIASPGLLTLDRPDAYKSVIDGSIKKMKDFMFPTEGDINGVPGADAPLWFINSLQHYATYLEDAASVWKKYGKTIQLILKGYLNGEKYGIVLCDDGLLKTGMPNTPVTWMNAMVDGKAVTSRNGKTVEINTLWYNAMMFALEAAKAANDLAFADEWRPRAQKIPAAFKAIFWDKQKGYLADYVAEKADWSIRPNMVFVTSLKYSPVNEEIKREVLETIKNHLVTPRGLRSLSPRHPDYKGEYKGNLNERNLAYHQGAAWPWLLAHFAEGYLKLYGKQGLAFAKDLYYSLQEEMQNNGVGSISEVYEGNPPHLAAGNISQAWNVAEILRLRRYIRNFVKDNNLEEK